MENYFKAELKCLKAAKDFSGNYPTETSAILEWAAEETKLGTSITNIENAQDKQGTVTTGITEDTLALKKDMTDTVIQIAHKAKPLARIANNNDLVKKLDHEVSYINGASALDALSRARDIRETLFINSGILTNVKPADITSVDNAINAYAAAQLNPWKARQTKKLEGTDALIAEFQNGNEAMQNMFDYLYGYYKKTNPDIVKAFGNLMMVEVEGVRHTRIMALCVDDSAPANAETSLLQGVQMKIVELDLIATGSIYGLCGISKFMPGTYHIEFSKDGYVTNKMIVFIKRGHTEEVEVHLVKVTP